MVAWLATTVVLGGEPGAPAPVSSAGSGRLAHWDFDLPGFVLPGNQPPLAGGASRTEPGWDGLAPLFRSTNAPAPLQFSAVGPAGQPRLAPAGGIRLLYRPVWSSGGANNLPQYAWGRGPGHWARLLEVHATGGATPGPVLAISVDPAGTNLVLQARDPRGVWRTNFQTALSWMRPQPVSRRNPTAPWREIALSYSPSNTVLVVNGLPAQDWSNRALAGPGVGLGNRPDTLVLTFGSDAAGAHMAEGALDEIETFDRALTPPDLYAFREPTALSAAVATVPPSVTLHWFGLSGQPVSVQRRSPGQARWVTLTNRFTGVTFTDAGPGLEPGETYDYDVDGRLARVSLAGRPVERRGRVIVLVEQSVARPLAAELDQLSADLVGDGWTVLRHEVPRHDYDAWSRQAVNRDYVANLQGIKRLILADHAAAPAETRAVLLVGHVTIPYSGVACEDGHADMNGAWPADAWYGDIDGVWSDQAMDTAGTIANVIRRNLPGDGKLDPTTFNRHIVSASGTNGVELAVGRIDFARLPVFGRRTEVELLRDYLRKDHRYRFGELRFERSVRVGTYFYSPYSGTGQMLNYNALMLGARLGPLSRVTYGDAFAGAGSSLWALQGGYGAYDTLHNSREAAVAQGVEPVTSARLAAGAVRPQAAFYLLKGSYFGDWNNYQNDLLKSLLAVPDSGLAAFWTHDRLWHFEDLGTGGTLGDGFIRTAQGDASTRTTFQLGDPTLRAIVTAPPSGAGARRRAGVVELNWRASPEAGAGYLVFRSRRGPEGPFERVTSGVVSGLRFTDEAAPSGRTVYQVRAAALVTTGSGSFTNLSQAAYATAD